MRFYFFMLACFLSYTIKAQTIQGVIRDPKGEFMPFVNVGIPNCSGTVTNDQGNFSLDISNCASNDTLCIGMLGYKLYRIRVSEIKSPCSIVMERSDYELKEVKISKRNLKVKERGNFNQSDNMMAGFKSNDLGSELLVKIPVKRDAWVKKFNFYISKNIFDTLYFRLNIYKIEKGKPTTPLIDYPIYVKTTSKGGWNTVNLEQYNIVVEGDFAIGLEWIKDLKKGDVSSGLSFSVGFLNNVCYFRKASMQEWETTSGFGVGFNVLLAE
jgi:hypothetical protein